MLRGLDVRKRGTATVCGATVTGAQLLAGASGPLLDAFYLETDVDRRSIVATKAFTQTVGHIIKVGYYLWISTRIMPDVESIRLSPFLIAGGMLLAVAGARIGTRLLDRFDDRQFRRVTGPVILALGALAVAQGVRGLLAA